MFEEILLSESNVAIKDFPEVNKVSILKPTVAHQAMVQEKFYNADQ